MCKYFERPLGNQLPKCVEGLPFLNKSHNNNNNNNNNNNGNFINLSKIYIVHYKDKPRLVR